MTQIVPREEVGHVEDIKIPGSEGDTPVRVYTPKVQTNSGGVVYFHEGGLVIGDGEFYDPFCRMMANASGSVVIHVEYRLAPEHKFPAAVVDSLDSVAWSSENARRLGATDGIVVAGDSAGGNLAAVSALKCRDRGTTLKAQVLVFPVTSFDAASRSAIEYGGPPISPRNREPSSAPSISRGSRMLSARTSLQSWRAASRDSLRLW